MFRPVRQVVARGDEVCHFRLHHVIAAVQKDCSLYILRSRVFESVRFDVIISSRWTKREQLTSWTASNISAFVLPAKAWKYVFTGVGLCVCVPVCDPDN